MIVDLLSPHPRTECVQRLQTNAAYKSYAVLVKKVSDSLMAAQVAVYPVDAALE